jgi:hypothetical protein
MAGKATTGGLRTPSVAAVAGAMQGLTLPAGATQRLALAGAAAITSPGVAALDSTSITRAEAVSAANFTSQSTSGVAIRRRAGGRRCREAGRSAWMEFNSIGCWFGSTWEGDPTENF